MPQKYVLLRHREVENIGRIDTYLQHDGYDGLKKALQMEKADLINLVKASGLRGRGGAGFPTGLKWSFIPKGAKEAYIVINTDESETGTFKDRELLENNPHQVIEGALIAAYAVGATRIYNYWRGEYMDAAYACMNAVAEAYEKGFIGKDILGTGFNCEFVNHFGAGAYICGEETALLNSLMGDLGQPWSRPPFPAIEGVYEKPTVVNNTETLANVPQILLHGAEWYKSLGSERSPGTKIVCLSGHINRPGNYEVELGSVTYEDLIFGDDFGQGIPNGKQFKALLPSGGSGPLMKREHLHVPLTYEGPEAVGSVMGSASLIVMDETVDMVWAAAKATHFFRHESCGKCTPCREGTFWLDNLFQRILAGHGTEQDVKTLESVANQIGGRTLCALGEFAKNPALSSIKHYPEDYRAKVAASDAIGLPVAGD